MENRNHDRQSVEPIELAFERVKCGDHVLENVTISIEEVSLQGIRFRTSADFKVGEVIHLSLPSIEVEPILEGRIAWKKQADADQSLYGMQVTNGQT